MRETKKACGIDRGRNHDSDWIFAVMEPYGIGLTCIFLLVVLILAGMPVGIALIRTSFIGVLCMSLFLPGFVFRASHRLEEQGKCEEGLREALKLLPTVLWLL